MHATLGVGWKVRLRSSKLNRDGVLTTSEVRRCRHHSVPSTVNAGGHGGQRVPVQLDREFETNQTVPVNRVKVVKPAVDGPNIATGCVGSVLKLEGDP